MIILRSGLFLLYLCTRCMCMYFKLFYCVCLNSCMWNPCCPLTAHDWDIWQYYKGQIITCVLTSRSDTPDIGLQMAFQDWICQCVSTRACVRANVCVWEGGGGADRGRRSRHRSQENQKKLHSCQSLLLQQRQGKYVAHSYPSTAHDLDTQMHREICVC